MDTEFEEVSSELNFANEIKPEKKESNEKKIREQYLTYDVLPIVGTVLSIVCIFIFSFVPMKSRLGPVIQAFKDKSFINLVYYLFSLLFHVVAYYVPFHVLRKFKNFVTIEGEELSSLESGDEAKNKLWNAYRLTFYNKDFGLEKKTRANADSYFNFDSVIDSLSHKYPWSYSLKIIATSFIGLGILGTFIGFSYAMSEIKFSPDKMLESIQNLVENGLATAFNTSITGVFCSIIYNFLIYTPIIQKTENYFRELCDDLDKQYYISETEALMKYSMVTDDEDNQVTFSESLKLILTNMKEQSSALNNFNSDLADQISNLQKDMNTSIDRISNGVSGELKQEVLDGIHSEIDDLKSSLTTATEQLNATADSLSNVIERINGDVGQKITEFDEALVRSLEDSKLASEHLEELPDKIGSVSTLLQTTGNSLASVSDAVASNMASINNGFSDILSDLNSTQEQVAQLIVKAKANEEQTGVNIGKVLEETEKVLAGFKDVDVNLGHVFEQLTDQISKYTNTVGGNLDKYLSNFADASSSFSKSIKSSIDEFGNTIDTLNENLKNMQKTSDSFDSSVKHLEKAIKKE